MKTGLSYVLVTPYTIAKSRTGGILSRLLSRTDLDLVGARMFTADEAFARKYAETLRKRSPKDQLALLADYVEQNFVPSGKQAHLTLLLLFQGNNPCEQLLRICGHVNTRQLEVGEMSGETIRDTYADLIFSFEKPGEVRYFEPAVLTARSQEEADEDLRMMADFLEGRENVVRNIPPPNPSDTERTLVILKPDNWTYHSSRPGAIIDMFSRTGLRIVGVKIHRFSLAQALDFYGPVETVLKEKLAPRFGKRAKEFLEKEFRITLGEETSKTISETFGVDCAVNEFGHIVEFMSGRRPGEHSKDDLEKPGNVKCMILIYEGENAVAKIRDTLGPTNPAEAPDGTVRREFGSSVMVNTAHASDSMESFLREKDIVKIEENTLGAIIREYLG